MSSTILEEKSASHIASDVLVSTEWLAENLNNPQIRIIESNEDPLLYGSGHIPGAFEVDWNRDLNDPVRRDYLDKESFQALMRRLGVTEDTIIVFYGDKNNWWATYAFWVFELFGHTKSKILDGGRIKWLKEGREMTREIPVASLSGYIAKDRDDSVIRAFREETLAHVKKRGKMIDVRSPKEYSGEVLHMEGYPNEGALRGGHIPGAKNVPWARAVNPEDGTFKPLSELNEIYQKEANLMEDDDVIVYCRIGERSSHTWFVLHYLLGFKNVKNYDGSWTEWGNSVGVPVAKGAEQG